MNKLFNCFVFGLLLMAAPHGFAQNTERINLFPKLDPGKTIRYQIGYRAETRTSTESNLVAPMAPTGGKTDAHLLLQVEVVESLLESGKSAAHLRTRIVTPDSLSADSAKSDARDKSVEFLLHHDGQLTNLTGLNHLSPDELAIWREWIARFAASATFPERGVKPGDKWKSEESITTALLSGLSWEKESVYVKDSPCAAHVMSPQGDVVTDDLTLETCAVILTTATIKQKSNVKDATPEDYKLHELRNMGYAKGTNEGITYISLKTGLVVRATEDASQSLNAIVTKSDASNRVHYLIDAESHMQILLLAEAPASHP